MTLFNFQNENNEEFNTGDDIECNCEKCSQLATVELIASFTDIILNANSEDELLKIVGDLVEIAKIQAIKEYLHETIVTNSEVLDALSNIKVEYLDIDVDDFYGSNGDWNNRL